MLEIDLVEALLHGTLELIGDLSISVSVEDAPLGHRWLGEHLRLDLSIKLSRALLDVHFVWSSRTCRTHDKVASVVLVTRELSRDFLELDVPVLGLFLALVVLSERLEQARAFLDLLLGSGVDDLREILHEPKVCSHLIGQPSQLAQFRNQSNLIASLAILVDEEWLIDIGHILIVPRLVVLQVAHLFAILFECGLRRHVELNA